MYDSEHFLLALKKDNGSSFFTLAQLNSYSNYL